MMKAADWIIDLGPGAADEGGKIVAQGTPELVSRCKGSATGRFLAAALAQSNEEAHA
jgi:excinuclease ABC subunit A